MTRPDQPIVTDGLTQPDITLMAGGVLYLDIALNLYAALTRAQGKVAAAQKGHYDRPEQRPAAIKAAKEEARQIATEAASWLPVVGETATRLRKRMLDDPAVAAHADFKALSDELSRAWGDAVYAHAAVTPPSE